MSELQESKENTVFVEDAEGNFQVITLDNVYSVETEPDDPKSLTLYKTKDKTYYSLHSEQAIDQCNAYLQNKRNR